MMNTGFVLNEVYLSCFLRICEAVVIIAFLFEKRQAGHVQP